MQTPDIIFSLIVLLFSIIIHEVAHGYAALFQGDSTAKYENRLTLNPAKHIDLFGTIVLPILLYLSHLPVFGWAKPVPFNPYNLRNRRWGEAIVALAGPATNLTVAVIFGLILRFGASTIGAPAVSIIALIVFYNILLAVFNLVPIAPLDGSKVLFAFLPASAIGVRRFIEQYSLFLLLLFIFVLWNYVYPIVNFVFGLIVGVQLG